MSYPEFSDFPPIPQRSAAEADFDTKMSALFQHFATTHRAELIALIDFLKTGSTIIGGALNATTVGLTSPAEGKFTALEADSLGGDAVQASKSDATLGKLLKVGAFGLGGEAISPSAGISIDDSALPNGTYRYDTAITPGTVPAGVDGIWIHVQREGGLRAHQIAMEQSSNSIFIRYWSGSSWSSWQKFFHQNSILGTVSQSGGVPTGAIIERGSNANGKYTRYADGTQICWGEINAGSILSVGVGTFAEPYSTATFAWTFPASFIDLPNFSGSALAGTGSVYDRALDVHATSVNLTGASTINVIRKTGSAADVSPVAHLRAIGRWF